ncbi:30S ribosomal protein S12 methylthiotransferase accessory factor YcaO [Thorsellia anophelis]|uniref:Ribosomal protein S12 methylthiotransferase accessory factor n=1 Tax=Thorsellia anophelis DSM 18579 TaxID=1123402 RepID=A0A1I0DTS3_9GAMM|nr:30S ribosomal protein S12 methylthiotransferase accessory factor YcaO [Thorsellia anophelis]SET35601.1 ribosomal protein S12 methylthiotransferase accessory factor [Thorsellia anophelis DSM 18579]
MQKTYIPGKDAALEDSIDFFQAQLSKLGFNIEEASWLNPVPNVWSVHIKDKECALCFTNGKGATKKAALASALGEFFERLSTNYFFADFYLGEEIANSPFVHYPSEKWFPILNDTTLPEGLLDERLYEWYDPDKELNPYDLIDMQSSLPERGICALPFTRQLDGKTIFIPMNIIGNLYVSNGMAAGNSFNEAKVQALSEVFERYVKNRVIRERITLPSIPDEVTQRFPKIYEAISTLEAEGFPIYRFDSSLGGKFPVIAVVLLNPENGSCFASFGAHPKFEVAYERAVTELLQGRSLNSLDVFPAPTFDDEEVGDAANLETHFIDSSGVISWDLFKSKSDYPFIEWNFSGSTEEELINLTKLVNELGSDIYSMEYNHLGVTACRLIVPGLSEVYQPEDLIYANNTMGIHLRNQLLSLASTPITQDEAESLINTLYELDLDETIRIRELLGIATGPATPWYTLRVGELKAMLYLTIGDFENALMWVEWTLDFNQSVFSKERVTYYRCLHNLLLLTQEQDRNAIDYYPIFIKMYGQSIFDAAIQAMNGSEPFYGLSINGQTQLTALSFESHRSLISAYKKLQLAKRLNA